MRTDYLYSAEDETFFDGIRRMDEFGSGLVDVYLIDPRAAARLLADARRGNAKAARLFDALVQTGRRIVDAPRRSPALCVACPRCIRRIERDVLFGIAVPSATTPSEPSSAIGFAICSRCASGDPEAWMAKAEAGLRLIWPDLRPVVVTHPDGGRA